MILFIDVDGTIIDSYPGIAECARRTFAEMGHPIPDEATLRTFPGPPLRENLITHGIPPAELDRAEKIYRGYYRDFGWRMAQLFAGWARALPAWKAAGYTLCTATSKDQSVATRMLERLGVAEYFDYIGGADDAHGTRPTKRHVIEWVLDEMNLRGRESEILMIGDRSHDTEGAHALGMKAALVGWGHGTQAEFDAADFFAPDFPALDKIVARWGSTPTSTPIQHPRG
ncbi:HAD hydrolase-like protein [Corynebacterium sp.]|uniref:HAD hydrolase-like protein n=1 Tax=Corynebacterium sp. TaxID=1720 RepID=UPI0026DDB2A2|nr:HAD hydrolase-like protein [Corynebacterium sp.]MDO5031313.1 HAD hydrolase-like protein [Corynebacterium sp.]